MSPTLTALHIKRSRSKTTRHYNKALLQLLTTFESLQNKLLRTSVTFWHWNGPCTVCKIDKRLQKQTKAMQHDWNKYMAWSTGGWLPAWTQCENCRSAHVNAQADPIHGPSSLPEWSQVAKQYVGITKGGWLVTMELWDQLVTTTCFWSCSKPLVGQNRLLRMVTLNLEICGAQIAIYIDVKTATWFQQIHGLADSQLSNVCQVLISNGSTLRLAGSCPWCNPLSLLLPHQIGIKSRPSRSCQFLTRTENIIFHCLGFVAILLRR